MFNFSDLASHFPIAREYNEREREDFYDAEQSGPWRLHATEEKKRKWKKENHAISISLTIMDHI